jgi:enamine deaminase RidA (YjgF/YER057c/UK114 family)
MSDFAEMNAVWDAWVDGQDPPARATGEARLAAPGYKVEIIVVAATRRTSRSRPLSHVHPADEGAPGC